MISGIYHYYDDYFKKEYRDNLRKTWKLEELTGYAYKKSSYNLAGFSYTSSGYILAGMIIKQATGKEFSRVIEEQLLNIPEFNDDIFYWDRPLPEIRKGLAERFVYGYYDGKPLYENNLSIGGPGGGMIATTEGIVKWYKLLFIDKNKNLFPLDFEDLVEKYNVLMADNSLLSAWYGLGIGKVRMKKIPVDYVLYGYKGETITTSSVVVYSPQHNFIISASINAGYVDLISFALKEIIMEVLFNHIPEQSKQAL